MVILREVEVIQKDDMGKRFQILQSLAIGSGDFDPSFDAPGPRRLDGHTPPIAEGGMDNADGMIDHRRSGRRAIRAACRHGRHGFHPFSPCFSHRYACNGRRLPSSGNNAPLVIIQYDGRRVY